VWECGGSIYGAVEEVDGRGAAGNGGEGRRRRGEEGGRRPEEGDDPDRWAPPVGGRMRERGRGGGRSGPCGPKDGWAGGN
jgi:hypothetical protein